MKGFYSIREAARILGTNDDAIRRLIKEGNLRRTSGQGKAWVPQSDVHELYDRGMEFRLTPSMRDLRQMSRRIDDLEHQLRVVQTVGLGYDIPLKEMDDPDLLLFREKLFALAAKTHLPISSMQEVSDTFMVLRETEVMRLYRLAGDRAWSPAMLVLARMTSALENHEDFPRRGLDVLHARLEGSRNRLLGMLQLGVTGDGLVEADVAVALLRETGLGSGPFETALIGVLNDENS